MIASQTFDRDTNSSSDTLKFSTFTNTPSGIASQVIIADDASRRVKFITDMNGEVMVRDEDKNSAGAYIANGPYEVWHRFNGREMNYTTNNAGSNAPLDYAASIAKRTAKPSTTTTGMFAGGSSTTGGAYVDIDSSFEGINSFKQGASGGQHVVQNGETLQSIAQSTWGDSALWYKIAEANGLSADSLLMEGQALTIPAGVIKTTNNASTFKPYSESEALGDTAPTRIKPPKPKKVSLFGQILLAVIKTAVGNLFGQLIGVATGLQEKFSWKELAISAITAAVTAGIGPGGIFGSVGFAGSLGVTGVAGAAVNGAVASAVSQGISVATGLQKKFDWVGVAAAGVSSAVGAGISGRVQNGVQIGGVKGFGNLSQAAQAAFGGSARLIANAATRSLIQGSDFGDNVLAGLPDVIGQTIGGMAQDGIAANSARQAQSRANATAIGNSFASGTGTAMAGPGAGNGATATPTTGVGGGQVGQPQPSDDEAIVVTGQRVYGRSAAESAEAAKAQQARWDAEDKQNSLDSEATSSLPTLPTTASNNPLDLGVIDQWERDYDAYWQKNNQGELHFDPVSDQRIRQGFADWRAETMAVNEMADQVMLADAKLIGETYWNVSSTMFAPIGAIDTAYQAYNGNLSAADAAIALATLGRGSKLRAAESVAGPLNTRVALQSVTDRAVADLAADPGLARDLMSPGSYQHLVEGTNLAPASYGKAVERLTGRYVQADPELSQILSYQSRPFVSTPDFLGHEGYNLRTLDITTEAGVATHLARPYGAYTEYVTHPGLPSNLVFPR